MAGCIEQRARRRKSAAALGIDMTDATPERKAKKIPSDEKAAEAFMDGHSTVRPKSDVTQ